MQTDRIDKALKIGVVIALGALLFFAWRAPISHDTKQRSLDDSVASMDKAFDGLNRSSAGLNQELDGINHSLDHPNRTLAENNDALDKMYVDMNRSSGKAIASMNAANRRMVATGVILDRDRPVCNSTITGLIWGPSGEVLTAYYDDNNGPYFYCWQNRWHPVKGGVVQK